MAGRELRWKRLKFEGRPCRTVLPTSTSPLGCAYCVPGCVRSARRQPPVAPPVATAKEDAKLVSGLYIASRRGDTTFFKLTNLFGELKVFTNSDGTISIDPLKGPNGELKRYTEISPLLYREVHGQDLVGFHRDASQHLEFSIDYPFSFSSAPVPRTTSISTFL